MYDAHVWAWWCEQDLKSATAHKMTHSEWGSLGIFAGYGEYDD